MNYKTVILVPNPAIPGGVGNFYKVAKPYFSKHIKYLYFNTKWQSGPLKYILNPLFIIWSCLRILVMMPKQVVVNPSLHKIALIRDAVFLLWSQLFSIKTTIYWRGWNPENEILLNKQPYYFLLKKAYLKANQHIVLNEYVKSILINSGVKTSCISMSSTLVDDSFFYEKSIQESNENKSPLSVLFLTRVEKYKGIYEALELIRNFDEDMVELHVVGNGSELDKSKDYIKNHKMKNVFFHGFLSGEAKKNAYKSADLYLFPSYSEGMPNSLLEAMGAGLPVLCTNVGALSDFFQNYQMGFLHNLPIKISDFKESLDFFLANPLKMKKMGDYNRTYAKNNFMASKVIKYLEEKILNQV